jgi:hypothetical protein
MREILKWMMAIFYSKSGSVFGMGSRVTMTLIMLEWFVASLCARLYE